MLRWMWPYVRKYRFAMGAALFLALCVSAMNMVNPTVAGMIVDRVIRGGEHSILKQLVVLMIGTTLVKCLVRFGYQIIFEHVSQNVIRKIRENLYDHIQGLDFFWFDRSRPGDVMTLMTSDLDAIRHFVAWVIYQIFENVMVFVFSIAVLASIHLRFTLLLLTVTPAIFLTAWILSRKLKPAYLAVRDQFARLNSTVMETIAGNRVVKAFVREEFERNRFMKENLAFKDRQLNAVNVRARFGPLIDSFASLLPVLLILAGGYFIMSGELTLGQLVTFNGLMWALSNPLNMIANLVNDTQRFTASGERIRELFRRETRIRSVEGALSPAQCQGRLEFRNVSFSYNGEKVLTAINFVVEPGMTIGILGPTGSGKTTLAKLMCRFYDPDEGEILLDNIPLRNLDLGWLRRNAGIAMQDVFLFSDTIEGNIAFGRIDAPVEEVYTATRRACAEEFIRELPAGYDTVVGERGVGLSGGQRQRIALARLLLSDPRIIILDDTTSSVDVETEAAMRASIASLPGTHTTIMIAHRISSLSASDVILVMDKGQIIDQGCHEELISRPGYYRDVWQHQNGV